MPPMTQQPPPGYGPPWYGDYRPPAPKHPQAITVLVLGILSLVLCGLIGPFAWSMGSRVVREIEASGGRWGGDSEATIGRILGIVATALLVISVLFLFVFVGLGSSLFFTSS
jgi:TRAP-type C4-dicarboxylate transport system permease small subunit